MYNSRVADFATQTSYLFSSSHTAYYLSPHRAHVYTRYTVYTLLHYTDLRCTLHYIHDFSTCVCIGSLTSVHTRRLLEALNNSRARSTDDDDDHHHHHRHVPFVMIIFSYTRFRRNLIIRVTLLPVCHRPSTAAVSFSSFHSRRPAVKVLFSWRSKKKKIPRRHGPSPPPPLLVYLYIYISIYTPRMHRGQQNYHVSTVYRTVFKT